MGSRWWVNFPFWVNYPFKAVFSLALPDQFKFAYETANESGTSQLIYNFKQALAMVTSQNASGCNWIDLQSISACDDVMSDRKVQTGTDEHSLHLSAAVFCHSELNRPLHISSHLGSVRERLRLVTKPVWGWKEICLSKPMCEQTWPHRLVWSSGWSVTGHTINVNHPHSLTGVQTTMEK